MSIERKNVHSMNDFTEMFRELGNEKLIMKKIPTGILSLDTILGGGLVAGVHTICAEPGAGKTSLVLDIAVNCAIMGIPVIMFSYEVPLIDVVTKIYSYISASQFDKNAFSFMDIRVDHAITTSEQKKYTKVWEFVEANIKDQITFVDCIEKPYTAEQIAYFIDEFVKETQKTPLIIIDYLQMIAPQNTRLSTKNNIEIAMSVLHAIAEKHCTPILSISSIAKQSSDTLSLFSAAEAARIAYSSVTVLGLQEASGTKSDDASYKTMRVSIFKNRYGTSGTSFKLAFDGEHSRFMEIIPPKKKAATSKKDAKS